MVWITSWFSAFPDVSRWVMFYLKNFFIGTNIRAPPCHSLQKGSDKVVCLWSDRDGWTLCLHREKKQNLPDNDGWEEIHTTQTPTAGIKMGDVMVGMKGYQTKTDTANSDLRHYIPALRRRSKCSFRRAERMRAVFKAFVAAYSEFVLNKHKLQKLKSTFTLTQFVWNTFGHSRLTFGIAKLEYIR